MEKVDFNDLVSPFGGDAQRAEGEADMDSFPPSGEMSAGQRGRNTHINIGTGKEISIKELVTAIKAIVGFKGTFYFNMSKPDGTLRKLTDSSKLHNLGWKHSIELKEGIEKMYNWYLN